jgi:hypothetical protein
MAQGDVGDGQILIVPLIKKKITLAGGVGHVAERLPSKYVD